MELQRARAFRSRLPTPQAPHSPTTTAPTGHHKGTPEDRANRPVAAAIGAVGEPKASPYASLEARKDAKLRVAFRRVLHAPTPFGPKACTFRADFPQNAPIRLHAERKKGRVLAVNRRPLLLSHCHPLGAGPLRRSSMEEGPLGKARMRQAHRAHRMPSRKTQTKPKEIV